MPPLYRVPLASGNFLETPAAGLVPIIISISPSPVSVTPGDLYAIKIQASLNGVHYAAYSVVSTYFTGDTTTSLFSKGLGGSFRSGHVLNFNQGSDFGFRTYAEQADTTPR